MNETLWRRSDEWIGATVEDALVMISVERGTYLHLNPTAAAAWDILESPVSAAMITEYLSSRFAVTPEHCAQSVATMLHRFEECGLIVAS